MFLGVGGKRQLWRQFYSANRQSNPPGHLLVFGRPVGPQMVVNKVELV
jgi:hypothetical protein